MSDKIIYSKTGKVRREMSLIASICGIFLATGFIYQAEQYFYGFVVAVSSIGLAPWRMLYLLCKSSYVYAFSLVFIYVTGSVAMVMTPPENAGLIVFSYLMLVYFWVSYSEKFFLRLSRKT